MQLSMLQRMLGPMRQLAMRRRQTNMAGLASSHSLYLSGRYSSSACRPCLTQSAVTLLAEHVYSVVQVVTAMPQRIFTLSKGKHGLSAVIIANSFYAVTGTESPPRMSMQGKRGGSARGRK